jgi:hypothetical protein
MSYRKILVALIVFSLFITLFGCSKLALTPPVFEGEEEGVLYLEPDNIVITPGRDFEIDLKVASVTELKGYSVFLSYDPNLLSLQGVTEGLFLSSENNTFFYKSIDNNEGNVLVDCAILDPDLGMSGEGILATLSFSSLKAGSTTLTFKVVKIRDTENQEIKAAKTNVEIKCK